MSKTENDLQSMKYALYLKNKSQTVLNEIIANPTAITTMQSDLTTQLAQFETFLLKLQAKYGDLTQTTTTPTAVTQTPVTETPVTETPVTQTPVTQTPVTNPTGAVIAE